VADVSVGRSRPVLGGACGPASTKLFSCRCCTCLYGVAVGRSRLARESCPISTPTSPRPPERDHLGLDSMFPRSSGGRARADVWGLVAAPTPASDSANGVGVERAWTLGARIPTLRLARQDRPSFHERIDEPAMPGRRVSPDAEARRPSGFTDRPLGTVPFFSCLSSCYVFPILARQILAILVYVRARSVRRITPGPADSTAVPCRRPAVPGAPFLHVAVLDVLPDVLPVHPRRPSVLVDVPSWGLVGCPCEQAANVAGWS